MPQSPGGNQSTGETPSAPYVFFFLFAELDDGLFAAAKTIFLQLLLFFTQCSWLPIILVAISVGAQLTISDPLGLSSTLIGPLEIVGRTLEYRH